jgi:hypothetical protein
VEKTLLILLFAVTLVCGLVIGGGAVYIFHVAPNTQAAAPAMAVPAAPSESPVSQAPPPESAPAQAATTDAERARANVKSGEFLPLETITATLREKFPGEILGVKLGEDDGIAYYEFKVMTSGGRVIEVEVDPKTGQVVDVDDDD